MMPKVSDLRRWRSDCLAWATECVHVFSPAEGRAVPFVPAYHQEHFLREATATEPDGTFRHRTAVASWPRREGKTLCASIIAAWRLATREQQRIACLANSERQAASVAFDLVAGIFRDSPRLAAYVPEGSAKLSKLEVPALGNTCEVVPAAWRSIQGRRLDVLLSDELHAADAEATRAFEFASNSLETRDAQCLVSSQAGMPNTGNPVWRLWQARDEGHVFFDYLGEHVLPWAISLGERERSTLLPTAWRYQHANEWGSTGSTLFAVEHIERAAMDYDPPANAQDWQALLRQWGLGSEEVFYGVGLDRAGVGLGGDRSVWTCVARFDVAGGEPLFRVVRCDVLDTGSELEVLQAWQRSRAIVGELHRLEFESYGCSDVVEKVHGATLEAPSTQRQQGLFGRLYRVLAEGRLGFPAEAGVCGHRGEVGLLKAELQTFAAEVTGGGLTRFGVQSGHDDTVYSLAWALDAAASAVRPALFVQFL